MVAEKRRAHVREPPRGRHSEPLPGSGSFCPEVVHVSLASVLLTSTRDMPLLRLRLEVAFQPGEGAAAGATRPIHCGTPVRWILWWGWRFGDGEPESQVKKFRSVVSGKQSNVKVRPTRRRTVGMGLEGTRASLNDLVLKLTAFCF